MSELVLGITKVCKSGRHTLGIASRDLGSFLAQVTDKAVFARPPPEKGAVEENADTVLALSEEVAQVRQVIEALANREFTIRI